MGIFDVFKTKVNEATDKAGDVAGQTKDKVSDMMDTKKGGAADNPSAGSPAGTVPGAEATTEDRASNMMYEGGPVASTGEAAPGAGDGAPTGETSGGGMTQSIKDNVAKGVDKAGEMTGERTGNRYDDKIDTGVQQAKDKLG